MARVSKSRCTQLLEIAHGAVEMGFEGSLAVGMNV